VPPLRDRGTDIELLTDHILARLARDMRVPVPPLEKEARQKLAGYHYPGNVRELENILERAMALCGENGIRAADILVQETAPADNGAARLGEQLESVERDAIRKALEETRYNKTKAARRLGLTLRALRYRMQKLGLD